jgi:hypothetical protein
LTHSVPLYMTGNFPYWWLSTRSEHGNNIDLCLYRFSDDAFLLPLIGVEVSPLSSYAGENLEAICRGRTFHAPSEISF